MTRIVAIDAGHGINTPGKRTPSGEREWSFNTVVAQSIINHLNNYQGVKTVRLDDSTGKRDVPLRERTNKANKANADILISCHHNANTGRWGNWTGTETYHYPKSTQGNRLAKTIHPYVLKAYGLRDRGIKSANFHMLRESKMPAILIEGGFMDSNIDIKKLRNKKVLENAGRNIAEGIAKYLGLKKKPSKQTGKLYKVQIGAYKQKKNADAQARRAKDKGFDQYIVKEKGLYKVQIGAFSKKSNANVLADKAKKAGFDVYIEGATKSTSKSKPKPKVLKVGQKVKIKSSAKKYATGETIPAWVKKQTHTIQQVTTTKVLLKIGRAHV